MVEILEAIADHIHTELGCEIHIQPHTQCIELGGSIFAIDLEFHGTQITVRSLGVSGIPPSHYDLNDPGSIPKLTQELQELTKWYPLPKQPPSATNQEREP